MTRSLAGISARRPVVVICVWAALAVAGLLIALTLLPDATTTELRLSAAAESERAHALLEARYPVIDPLGEIVVLQSDSLTPLTVDSPEYRRKVETLFSRIMSLSPEIVGFGRHYYQQNDETLVSADRKTTMIELALVGDLDKAVVNVERLLEMVAEADDFRVLMVGAASSAVESNELAREDLEKGERFGILIALVILLVLFGAVVAALMPLGVSIVSIVISLAVVALIGQSFQMVFFVTMMVTMIGLAVGIDYSLFIVSRFREELDRGSDKLEAIEKAGDTAGRAVLFSGVTVIIALIGMLLVPALFFRSLGLGAIIVVAVSIVVTLTLLPAALSLLGHRVNLLSVPLLRRAPSESSAARNDGFWEKTTRAVARFPALSVLAVGVPMVAVSFFYFQITTGINGVDVFPEGSRSREAFLVLEEEFSFGLVNPVKIVIDGDASDPRVAQATEALIQSLVASPAFPLPPAMSVNPAGDLAFIAVALPGEPSSRDTVAVVRALRDDLIPEAFDGVPAEVLVTGISAITADLFDVVDAYTPIVFAFVLSMSFVILMIVFRSIVIPVKAVIMNLLSVGTSYGLMVLVFQKGFGADLLGFQRTEYIDAWIPLFLFTILFGLSMDYHVFLLSRIRERYDQTGDNTAAVIYGLRSTAGLITGAALIMVAVFGAFAAGKTVINQQVGFGLAVAIFLDATLVRSVLVPASMELLGRGNWYLPPFLRWLPDARVEPVEDTPTQ